MRLAACAAFLSLLLIAPASAAPEASPGKPVALAVVDSPLVEKWLDGTDITFQRRSGASLGATPIQGVKCLVVPLESVNTPGAAETIRAFANGGGKVLAIYWGTLAAEGADAFPAYQLCNLLGVRPAGWIPQTPSPLVLTDPTPGVLPSFGPQVLLPRTPTILVEPLPGTRVLARWSSDEAQVSASRNGAAFLRGNTLYLTPDLLRPSLDRPEGRELFFWALQRLAPEVGAEIQARDRIGMAVSAYNTVNAELGANPSPELRTAADEILASLAEARAQLGQGRAVRAVVAADRARAQSLELTSRLRSRQQ